MVARPTPDFFEICDVAQCSPDSGTYAWIAERASARGLRVTADEVEAAWRAFKDRVGSGCHVGTVRFGGSGV